MAPPLSISGRAGLCHSSMHDPREKLVAALCDAEAGPKWQSWVICMVQKVARMAGLSHEGMTVA